MRTAIDTNVISALWSAEPTATRMAALLGQARLRAGSSGATEPKRLLADFIMGAHAERRADRLLTLDPERFARCFPELWLEP